MVPVLLGSDDGKPKSIDEALAPGEVSAVFFDARFDARLGAAKLETDGEGND